MKNIRFYTIAVLFAHLTTPKGNHLHEDIWYSSFDIGSHVISCLREWEAKISEIPEKIKCFFRDFGLTELTIFCVFSCVLVCLFVSSRVFSCPSVSFHVFSPFRRTLSRMHAGILCTGLYIHALNLQKLFKEFKGHKVRLGLWFVKKTHAN